MEEGRVVLETSGEKYPGFYFSRGTDYYQIYENKNSDRRIMEVLGKTIYLVDPETLNYEEYLEDTLNGKETAPLSEQQVIAVLYDDDVALYEKLRWFDLSYNPPKAIMRLSLIIILALSLLALNSIICFHFFPEFKQIIISSISVVATFFEFWLILFCYEFFLINCGIRRVKKWVKMQAIKYPEKNKNYYRDLFKALSKANCSSVSDAAQKMSKIL